MPDTVHDVRTKPGSTGYDLPRLAARKPQNVPPARTRSNNHNPLPFYLLLILIALVEQFIVFALLSYLMFGGIDGWFV